MHWTEWILAYGPNSSQRWASNQVTETGIVLAGGNKERKRILKYFRFWFIKLLILRDDDAVGSNIFICIEYRAVSIAPCLTFQSWLRAENIKSVLISWSTNTADGQSCKLRPDTAQSSWGVLNGIWLEQPRMECRSPLLTKIRENKGKGKNLSGD